MINADIQSLDLELETRDDGKDGSICYTNKFVLGQGEGTFGLQNERADKEEG